MKVVPAALAEKLLRQSEAVFTGQLARLEDVAAAVAVSRATLYYYFGGHDDLRAFLITEHVLGGSAAIAAADDHAAAALERLRAVLVAMMSYLGDRPGFCAAVLSSFGGAGANVELASALQLNDNEIAEPIRAILRNAAAEGTIDSVDVAAAADAIVGGALFAVLGQARRGPVDATFAQHVAHQLVRSVMRK